MSIHTKEERERKTGVVSMNVREKEGKDIMITKSVLPNLIILGVYSFQSLVVLFVDPISSQSRMRSSLRFAISVSLYILSYSLPLPLSISHLLSRSMTLSISLTLSLSLDKSPNHSSKYSHTQTLYFP